MLNFCAWQKTHVASKGKRKGSQAKSASSNKDAENRVPGASRICILENTSSSGVPQGSTSNPFHSKTAEIDVEASFHDENLGGSIFRSDSESVSVAATVFGDIGEKQVVNDETDAFVANSAEAELSPSYSDMETIAEVLEHARTSSTEDSPTNVLGDVTCSAYEEELLYKDAMDNYVENSSITCYSIGEKNDDNGIEMLDSDRTSMGSSLPCASNGHQLLDYPDNSSEFGDWKVLWDPFYKRNYFYNMQSQESTWYPTPGLEQFAFCPTVANSNEFSTDIGEEHIGISSAGDALQDINLYGSQGSAGLSQEKEVDSEHLNHSSENIFSTRMGDDLIEDLAYKEADDHAFVAKFTDEQMALHSQMDYSTGHTQAFC